MSFADGVRQEVAQALFRVVNLYSEFQYYPADLVDEMVDPSVKDVFRPLLQVWGTDFRRAQDPDYWVRALEARIDRSFAEDRTRTLVVDDARFPNEFELLRSRGFKFVRLESGASTRPLTGAQLAHESERHWPTEPVDLVLPYTPGPAAQATRILRAFGGE